VQGYMTLNDIRGWIIYSKWKKDWEESRHSISKNCSIFTKTDWV